MEQQQATWEPSRATKVFLTVLGLDARDYQDRSEVSWPYYLVWSALSTGLLAAITFSVAAGIIWEDVSIAGRIAAGVVGLTFITMLDLWAVSWQPDASRKLAAIHTGRELPTEIVPPMPPWRSKALALVPRLIVAAILAMTIGTFLAIAMNQQAVQQEKTQLLLENEASLVTNADAPQQAKIAGLEEDLKQAQADYATARAAEEDANNRVKCEAGQFGEPTYKGAACGDPGGDGLAQAQAIRAQARTVLDRATTQVNEAQSALDQARSTTPRSQAADVRGAATSQGLENTIKAWWNLVSEETSPIALVLLFIPHILAITLDLTPVLLKLLRGYQVPEVRRWRRTHIDSWYQRQAVLSAAAPLQAPWLMTMDTVRGVREEFWGQDPQTEASATDRDDEVDLTARDQSAPVTVDAPPARDTATPAADHSEPVRVEEPALRVPDEVQVPETVVPTPPAKPKVAASSGGDRRRSRSNSDDEAWRIELNRMDPYR